MDSLVLPQCEFLLITVAWMVQSSGDGVGK